MMMKTTLMLVLFVCLSIVIVRLFQRKLFDKHKDAMSDQLLDMLNTRLDHTSEKRYLESLRSLSLGQRAIYSTWIVQCEVENGGFAQYFWNMEEEGFYDEAIIGFAHLEATAHLKIFEEALESIRPHLQNMHKMQGTQDRFTLYKPLLQREDLYDKFIELDCKFYDLRPSLEEIRLEYIKLHPEVKR